ncbi:hypothetical protein [Paenibacillus aestuarii]|uniref:Uncharacterized protein n=1 Tax=Paenibacillus aestuarii TaxID=516965 RepID=A0ABW0K9J7_9BACL|nr:hypothetical protein [Paenibacillus aestuarii]
MTEKKNGRVGKDVDEATIDSTSPTIAITGFVYGMFSGGESIIPVVAQCEGTTIPLYTLPLGSHVLIANVGGLAGSTDSQSILYETNTSVDSLKTLVTYFVNAGLINLMDVANRLLDNLAKNDLKSFANEVEEQSDVHISRQAATYLLRDAQTLILKGEAGEVKK